MEFSADDFLSAALGKRVELDALRSLSLNQGRIDFCSNDYLGFARSAELSSSIEKEYSSLDHKNNGSGGSRLLAGNTAYAEMVEREIAAFHNAEAALIYNSGYDANVGLFSSLGQKGTTIIYDELIHASVHDGIRMSSADTFMFRHNDLFHLEERLKIAEGVTYVAIEGIYSMDGDFALLEDITNLCDRYNASLIVDEAHSTGVFGKGKGLVQELGLEDKVFARVHTFGKALGCHGAAVVGSKLLRDYQVNFSRAFIFTTALPLKSIAAIRQAYSHLAKSNDLIRQLGTLIALFKEQVSRYPEINIIDSKSPVQCVLCSGNSNVKQLAAGIQARGFDVRPILSPTVAKGKERLRICIHAYNKAEELVALVELISKFFQKK
jgi:8-amino-7-oxononanoate synthase